MAMIRLKTREDIEREALEEIRAADPVVRSITYHYFVSRSKGWRNGKQRLRRNWKEVRLIKYRDGTFKQWHRFPFDVYATEIIGEWADGEMLKERIENIGAYATMSNMIKSSIKVCIGKP